MAPWAQVTHLSWSRLRKSATLEFLPAPCTPFVLLGTLYSCKGCKSSFALTSRGERVAMLQKDVAPCPDRIIFSALCGESFGNVHSLYRTLRAL